MEMNQEKRKRQRKPEKTDTVNKKVKDSDEDNSLDLTSDIKPILSMGLVLPSKDEVVQIDPDLF